MSNANCIHIDALPANKHDYVIVQETYDKRKKHLIFLLLPNVLTYYTTTYIAKHHYSTQTWYDMHILDIRCESDRPKCVSCGKPALFLGVQRGYSSYCSHKCSAKSDTARTNNRNAQLAYWQSHPETRTQISKSLKLWHATHELSAEVRMHKSNAQLIRHAKSPGMQKQIYTQMMQSMSTNELLQYCRTRWSKGGRGKRHILNISHYAYCLINNCNVYDNMLEVKSNFEFEFIQLFELCKVYWSYESIVIHIDNIYDGYYLPDFILQYADKSIIVECKMSKFMHSNRTQQQIIALQEYCKRTEYDYLVLTENDLTPEVFLQKLNSL